MKQEPTLENETPEDEILKQILIQIERYKRNQLEFFEAIDEFIISSDILLDDE
ncbi:hypothetical protein [Flavobacterium sp. HTF]|uniref:hypothetical protein n=1 Tax=Flavobacterium sp. HTF TaxID=2170732 RepID=UPI0014031EE8|nr:hypothetical protein [Flavobacterium sp. HTF]